MPRVKLASQRLTGSGSQGRGRVTASGVSAQAGMVSPRAGQIGARFAVPSINPNVANRNYKPVRPNDIVVDKSLDAAAKLAGTWIESAFKYQDRQDQFTANEVVLEHEEAIRRSQTGYVDDDGNRVEGYLYTEGKDSIASYNAHVEEINTRFEEQLARQSPNVRQKALLRMIDSRNNALARAAKHNNTQFEAVERQQRYEQNQSLMRDIEQFGPAVWDDGTIAKHLEQYEDPAERDAVVHMLGQYSMYEAYNQALASTPDHDPEKAYAAARVMFESIKPHMGPEAKQRLEHWLNGKWKQAEANKKKQSRTDFKRHAMVMDAEMPRALTQNGIASNYEAFFGQLDEYRELYSDETLGGNEIVASNKVTQALLKSIENVTNDPRYVRVQDRVNAAEKYLGDIIEADEENKITKIEQVALRRYVQTELPVAELKKQKDRDSLALAELGVFLTGTETVDDLKVIKAPEGMLIDNQEKFMDIQQNYINEKLNGVPAKDMKIRDGVNKFFTNKMNEEPLTEEQMNDLFDRVANGTLGLADYRDIYFENRRRKDPTYKEPAVLKTDQYEAVKRGLKTAYKGGFFDPDEDMPKDENSPEYAQWQMQRELEYGNALTNLRESAIKAARDNQPFDPMEWWKNYQTEVANNGKKTKPGFLRRSWEWLY